MDEEFRIVERIWRTEPTRDSYLKYVQLCRRLEIQPECYNCAIHPVITCVCGKSSCKFCSAHCSGADCDVFACPVCVDRCSICQGGICPGGHDTTCDQCQVVFCVDCTRYCEDCGDLYCGNCMSDEDDFRCPLCYEHQL